MAEINFHRLFIFHTVARLGSFTRAARELDISQPAVSIQVKELERSLDTTLLIRMRSGVSLTDTGETVFDYTRRIFTLADEMTNAIQDLTGLESGRLTIGSSSTPGEYILPLALGRFRERYPKVEISLSISNTRTVIDQILSRELDLGMAGAPVDIRGLASFLYVNDEVVLVTSPTHVLARKRRLTLQDVMSMNHGRSSCGRPGRRPVVPLRINSLPWAFVSVSLWTLAATRPSNAQPQPDSESEWCRSSPSGLMSGLDTSRC